MLPNNHRNCFLSLLAVIACAVALSGGVVRGQETPPTATATPIPVTITIWHGLFAREATLLTKWAGDYQAATPGTTIRLRLIENNSQLLTEVLDAIKRDQGPDLFIGSSGWAAGLVAGQRIAPLNDRIDREFKAQISDLSRETVTINDLQVAVPYNLQTTTLYYNKTLNGADKLPGTLPELLAAQPAFLLDFPNTAGIYLGLGGSLIDAAGAPTLVQNSATLQRYLGLLKSAYVDFQQRKTLTNSRVAVSIDQRFRFGQTPYLIDGTWKGFDLFSDIREKLAVAPLPAIEANRPWVPLVWSDCFYLNINALQGDAALKFLKYVTSVEAQKSSADVFGHIPVNPLAATNEPAKTLTTQAAAGLVLPAGPTVTRLWAALDQAVFAATVLGQSPEEAAQGAIKAVAGQ